MPEPEHRPRAEALLDLPWTKPPLSMNDVGISRRAKFARAAVIANTRRTAQILAQAAGLPRSVAHVTVQLHYRPRDNKRRDTTTSSPPPNPYATGSPAAPGNTPDTEWSPTTSRDG
jgi:crossover junction endodeoxyribonuclease RusA